MFDILNRLLIFLGFLTVIGVAGNPPDFVRDLFQGLVGLIMIGVGILNHKRTK